MHRIEYEIGLNEQGRPYIGLPEDYEQRPEDRFFALEICRYMLQDLLARRSPDLDPQTIGAMDESERLFGQLGDEVAAILYEGMKNQGDVRMIMDAIFHVGVDSIEERDALPETNLLYNNAIFERVEGLKVGVFTPNDKGGVGINIFKLVDGTTNEHWVKL